MTRPLKAMISDFSNADILVYSCSCQLKLIILNKFLFQHVLQVKTVVTLMKTIAGCMVMCGGRTVIVNDKIENRKMALKTD